jgi:predicted PurR-regulated permease PerM
MEHKGMKRVFSALISVLLIMIGTAAISLLIILQTKKLAERKEDIKEKVSGFKASAHQFINEKLDIPIEKQKELISKKLNSSMESSTKFFKNFIGGIFGILGAYVLVLVFTFLFLFQRDKYEAFFIQVFGDEQKPDETKKIINHISKVSQKYLTGRMISVTIFTILFTIGNLIIGLEGAFLVGFASALLTIVPYAGSILGGIFSFCVALVTADTQVAIGALAVVVIVQTIDNYFMEPYIIGGQVNISGFFTILILLIGGLLWGIAGMVLFLPMLGVTKIIFDAIPKLKPYGYLIGDGKQKEDSSKIVEKIKKLFRKG